MSDFTAADIPDMTGRTVIITGANSGLGLETAKALAHAGAHVFLAVRNEAKGRGAAGTLPSPGTKEIRLLDLASLDSVRAFARDWSGQPVDLLINNAGVMIPPLSRTADGFESVIRARSGPRSWAPNVRGDTPRPPRPATPGRERGAIR